MDWIWTRSLITWPYSQVPSLLAIAWHVALQNASPKVHLDGKSSLNSANEMGRSLHLEIVKESGFNFDFDCRSKIKFASQKKAIAESFSEV